METGLTILPGDWRPLCAGLAEAPQETLLLGLLDARQRPIRTLRCAGDAHHVDLPVTAVAQAVARSRAAYLFMMHNHPSGDPRPSNADIAMTRHIWRLARLLGVSLQDHRIVSRTGTFSFRDNGLL